MPMLMKMMNEEPLIKMQTHAVSTTINFARGLIEEEDDEREDNNKNYKILMTYIPNLYNSLASLLKTAL